MASCVFCGGFAGFYAASATPPPHHTAEGFRNNYPHAREGSFWAWKWEQLRNGLPPPPPDGWETPFVRTDVEALRRSDDNPRLTWIGHASFLYQVAGMNVLFDPHFSRRASPVPFAGPRRIVALPFELEELPPIDVVMISHNHYDHLDRPTVRELSRRHARAVFLVPLGLKAWFMDEGIERVEEYDWWGLHEAGGLRFTLVPVQHWSRRSLRDTNRSLWGGWVVDGGGLKIIHTGDLGYSKDARDIGERLGPFDVALVPIGAYAPRWFMKAMHVDVPEAIQVRADLRAARAIGMHWGTFEALTDEPLDEPPAWLLRERAAAGLAAHQFDVMKVGETRSIRRHESAR